MKNFILRAVALLTIAGSLLGADAANDIILQQRKADNSGNIQRNLAPVASGFWAFDSSKVPTSPTFFTADATSLKLANTATAGLQLYNTADQTANYERLQVLWSSNIAQISTERGGGGTARVLRIDANSASLATRMDITPSLVNIAATRFSFTTNADLTNTSGTNVTLSITPRYNQTSGTAANTDLLINRTETAVGSGAQYLIKGQVGAVDRFYVTNAGCPVFLPTTNLPGGAGQNIGVIGGSYAGVRQFTAYNTNTGTSAAMALTASVSSDGNENNSIRMRVNSSGFTSSGVDLQSGGSLLTGGSLSGGLVVGTRASAPLVLATGATTAVTIGTSQQATFVGAIITTPQALSGAGAVNVTTSATFYTSTGGAQALTLADGTEGQIKYIVHKVDGGSGVLTPTGAIGFTTITFTNVGDSVTLIYTSAGWAIVGIFGAVAA